MPATTPTVRVAQFRAEQAREVLPMARDNQDGAVIAACLRVLDGWRFARRVSRADMDLVEAFAPTGD